MSWGLVKLKNCCKVVGGATPKRNIEEYWDSSDIPWVTPKDISKLDSPILNDAPEYISSKGFEACSTYLLPKGSVLFTSRAPIGNVAIAGRDMCTNQGFKSLVPSEHVDATYLYYCMLANASKIDALGNGATFKEVPKKTVEEFEIPLPYPDDPEKSLKEQKRIAAILDKADGIRRKRKQAIQLADDFLRSVFLDMFGDPVTNPKGWEVGTIRDLIIEAKYGSSGKADPQNGKYPILRMGNLTYSGKMDYTNLKYIDVSDKEKEKYVARKGDLLFNRTNSRELVGKTAVFDSNEDMIIAGYLIRVRSNEKSNTHYISGYLNSSHGKSTLLHMCKSIVGMANINAQELQDISIMKPPVTLQNNYRDICSEVEIKLSSFSESEEKLSTLFDSLSQRAFSKRI